MRLKATRPEIKAPFDRALARRIEEASLNAWPSLHQVLLDGWLLRFSGGFTKRANSIIPLYPSLQPSLEKIRYCENLYAREKLQTMFRLTSIDDLVALDETLAARKYRYLDPTSVMHLDLERRPGSFHEADGIHALSLQDWLNAYCELSGMPEPASQLHGLLLKSIRTDALFLTRYEGNTLVACGLGVVERELVGLYDILTKAERRGEGHGRALVEALLLRAGDMGAQRAYLQVMDDNLNAKKLYESLGFETTYKYWYRTSPEAPTP